ncbi:MULTISPECIES: PRC-barrel domain-containing protein [unclassified Hyphomonas]|uniref:PRC-barrel domain-containing protein n=1 Tax=unclassified Hyphomonas TaxID=2630699 RepID=UPI000AF6AC01|nr:PRC-barrel domain-containing protein [Hyphomonas sp. BRH_c22]|tara:strand:- start:1206 stop:1538 length:333 start_codon:yes stop_codon:yes gene_type:complete
MTHSLLSASSINGDSVHNAQGEDLGKIEDLMVDTGSGQIEYAVLSFGGFLGMGDKYFAVPFNRLSVDRENKHMVLNVEKDRLKNAPGFDKDKWPDFADPQFRTSMTTHYG